jgi:plastocyanin
MTPFSRILIIPTALLLTVALAGCGKSKSGSSKAAVPLGDGVIEGSVVFSGKPPARKILKKDAECGQQKMDVYDDAVLVGSDGGLKNVIVYLKDAPPAGDGTTRPPVLLDQVGCAYSPRVVALQTGQTLHVINGDNIIHNVHTESTKNPPINLAMPNGQSKYDLTFAKPEIFPIKCDVHSWMQGWIGVFPNPFFAVTDRKGHFTIKQLPPGTYTLVAHHERYGDLEQKITIPAANTPVQAKFTYKAP